jgi:hypothetical protein
MARYVLSKDNDKIILTDTKTGKKRTLSIDDIDYVVDDNQKLRDENTIATYFRLKEEDFKPKTVTKKANLVQEYKQATTKEKADTFDYVADFLDKVKLLPSELKELSDLPDESTINNFSRPPQEKVHIISLFKELKENLNRKKVNVFEFIKSYLKRNMDFDLESKYKNLNQMAHDLIIGLPEETKISNLQELYDQGIKRLGNIDLEKLNDMVNRLRVLLSKDLLIDKTKLLFFPKNPINIDEYIEREPENYNEYDDFENLFSTINKKLKDKFDLPKTIKDINLRGVRNLYKLKEKFKEYITEIKKYPEILKYFIEGFLDKPFLGINKTQFNGVNIKSLVNDNLKYFDDLNKIQQAINILFPGYIKVYLKAAKNYNDVDNEDIIYPPYKKNKINTKDLPKYLFNDFMSIIEEIDPNWHERVNNRNTEITGEGLGMGWTDKTLTRIDVIIDTLKGMGIGMGWSDKTLSRIDDILSQLKGMGDEIAGGWTDKTLNRIEIIMDTLKDMGNGVILTDKDIEYY